MGMAGGGASAVGLRKDGVGGGVAGYCSLGTVAGGRVGSGGGIGASGAVRLDGGATTGGGR